MNIASVSGSAPVSVPVQPKAVAKPGGDGDHDADDRGAAAAAPPPSRTVEPKGENVDLTA